jgi:hypothetical protein
MWSAVARVAAGAAEALRVTIPVSRAPERVTAALRVRFAAGEAEG